MQTQLAPEFAATPEGQAAEAILRKCVHCGFCTATCPTYQLLGDELDGPRGRIYLLKQVFEGAEVTRSVQQHLDTCLTCRNCESTCPSGVQYGQLVELGRQVVERKAPPRPAAERLTRWALREGLTSALFPVAIQAGQALRPLLPEALKAKVPARAPAPRGAWPTRQHARKVLLLAGCVQPTLMPGINLATAQVLDAVGIQTVVIEKAKCCGALRSHLSDPQGGLDDARRNIDVWWPLIERGEVEAIVMNASACGLAVKEYGHALAADAAYATKAERVAALARDLSELLPQIVAGLRGRLRPVRQADAGISAAPDAEAAADPVKLAFHPPCTLQHGQKLRGGVETHLAELGFEVHVARRESHLCCGSAGTYSVLQPEVAYALRDRKLRNLAEVQPQAIVSANIGCIQHLQSGTTTPVRHWVEVLAERLAA